jgi:hypothetical protein
MNGTLNIPSVFSQAVGRPDINVKTNLYGLFTVLPTTVVLIWYLGLVGAALSWIVYHLFSYFYAVPKVCSQCLHIPLLNWFQHILRVYLLISLTYCPAWILIANNQSFSLLQLFFIYFISTLFFVVGAYFLLRNENRQSLHRNVRMVKSYLLSFGKSY